MRSSIKEVAEQAILTGSGLTFGGSDQDLSLDQIREVKHSGMPQFRVMTSEPELEEDRVVRFVASDETPDRVGDVIQVSGWNLTNYKRNPVVLWGHDSNNTPPIGRAINVRRGVGPSGKAALLASIQFAPAEAHEFADTVYQLTKGGFLNAVSVGFMPRDTKDITDEERQELGMPSYGVLYTSADLLEISVVSVPANPSALITGAKSLVDSGILKGREVDRFLKQVPMNEEEVASRLKEKIRGFVDLSTLSKSADAEDSAEESTDEVAEVAEVEQPEEKSESDSESKDTLVAPEGLKHIAAIEETEGTVIITYIKAGFEGDEEPMLTSGGDYRPDEEDEKGASELARAMPELVHAQTEQTKALTGLIDAVNDLTKRIHSWGEGLGEDQRGFADSSDAETSDASQEKLREEKAHLEQLTNDFLQRLTSKLR